LAGKVQRKVSNGVAGLAAAGSSLDRPKIAAVPAPQRSTNPRASIAAEILALGPQLRFPRAAAQTRIVSVATIRPDPGNLCDLSKQIIFGDISEFEAHMPSQAVRKKRIFVIAITP
jgi:hypothetical protein